jgi:hypothetical protein
VESQMEEEQESSYRYKYFNVICFIKHIIFFTNPLKTFLSTLSYTHTQIYHDHCDNIVIFSVHTQIS